MQTKAEWLAELDEWERTMEYEDETIPISVREIRQYTRFRDNGRVFVAYSEPFSLGGNVFVTVWEAGHERNFRRELRLPEFARVEIVFPVKPHPFPKWYFENRKG